MQLIIDLVAYTVLHGLIALDAAAELKPDSNFSDTPIVITTPLLEFSDGLFD